ncbi:MAG: hypothetical protein AAFR39_11720 [Pseudomonadota bacterium]
MRVTKKIKLVFALTAICAATNSAYALDVPFTAEVDNPDFCLIEVVQPGALTPNATDTVLSSYNAGGTAALARVTSYWFNYQIQALHSQVWQTSPIANNQDTTFSTFYSGSARRIFGGGSLGSFPEVPGSTVVTLPFLSVTDLEINLVAQHDSGTFPGGDYTTNVTLLCN